MKNFTYLQHALQCYFDPELGDSHIENMEYFTNIQLKKVKYRTSLENELKAALSDANFPWLNIISATDIGFHYDLESHLQVRKFVCEYMWGEVFSDKTSIPKPK